jgi:glycosyltransferase involved in cell wall biosynthesis
VPLIHEFRDPWFDLPDESMPSQGGRERVRRAEQKLIDSADAIVTVTEGLSDLTRPKAGSTPIFTVTNGFDPEDLPQRPSARPRPFRLIHGGNLFVGRDEPLRAFLSAVAQVADEIPELELVFRGGFPAAVRAEYSNLEELGVLRVMPPIPGPAFMEELDNSFAALQFNSRQFPYALSTKIFEYGASRRPVLSLNYGGDIARLVLEHGLGWSIDASSPATVSDGLRAAHAEWRHNPGLCTSPTGFESYDYARIAADYRSRIESLL